ncbi:katanin p80 WD40 repeat-containing subunit B1 homolog KTN80.4 isoform X2 [Syzygium oleosum]|uniref:katanin p80 WD40 repeat-containing subunit B1 homolog KTN80.4 isoform X2 n=1 Tax=Syzygium oleosum TaxID=219896 RepID=UPI0024BB0712|nr:katanin p80 WD40 repeat-containing subunit B1 homolog KTN80.4 isoform X2 [Syzygium oleosum]
MTTKRAYKLQEFVAHSAAVNCLKIGRKSSRVLVTGGEDHKVNLWAIGKPNAILSLSGHSSGIDSVSFDSSEVVVAAGAASGTIKLWDLEEAKIVRTLTGHRSNCISVDFHPFGEFFASGSLDTNLKIWDIRKKGCIHTYKGHTRGVNAIRFTPDGRWVVSGGEDNTVKLWDLTAGKLLHDFKFHEGQVQCIDFHPHEFLLATGSADRTVKFWDLETFELIGSSGPESTGVRCLTFNPDGRTLLCGLHENLKVLSWEPILCHDTVDVGWSRLSDLNVHEGKLLGCSFNQSCVGVWVVDISRLEPYAVGNNRFKVPPESKAPTVGNLSVLNENTVKASSGRLSVSQISDSLVKETKSLGRLSVSQNSDPVKEQKSLASTGSVPGTPQRVNVNAGSKVAPATSVTAQSAAAARRNTAKANATIGLPSFSKSDIAPVIVPRTDARSELAAESKKEVDLASRTMPFSLQSKSIELRKLSNGRDELDQPTVSGQSELAGPNPSSSGNIANRNIFSVVRAPAQGLSTAERNTMDDSSGFPSKHDASSVMDAPANYQRENYESRMQKANRAQLFADGQRGGRMRSPFVNWEKREKINIDGPTPSITSRAGPGVNGLPFSMRGHRPSAEKETVSASDEDAIADVMERHDQFVGSMQSRLAKLQVVNGFWGRKDIKGAIGAMEKMADNSVLADVVSIVTEKIDMVTLDIFTCLLPLLNGLLESDLDRYLSISLDILLKLVRVFGSMVYSAVLASTPVGVDIEAEQRLERYNLCYIELERVKRCLPALTRGGSVAKSAHELSLALEAV